MATGTIKSLLSDRGFGFIAPGEASAGDKDLFFHHTDVQGAPGFDQLQVGQAVEYELGRDERRGTPKAKNVRPRA